MHITQVPGNDVRYLSHPFKVEKTCVVEGLRPGQDIEMELGDNDRTQDLGYPAHTHTHPHKHTPTHPHMHKHIYTHTHYTGAGQ